MPARTLASTLLVLLAMAGSGAAQSPSSARGAALDQSAALGVLSAINTSEIDAGNLALQKQVTGPVREYATRMVKEHGENNRKVALLEPDLAAAPAKAQMAKGQQELATLKALDGAAFAQAYVAAMVKDHTEALRALDTQLIPAASTPAVVTHLQTTRHHVADHLEAAKRLQSGDR
jgi:putative membrane protein